MRIEKIASLVDKDASLIDIGTDHAYLPIYLYKSGITKSVDGSDVSEEILKFGRKNLIKNNLDDKINLIVSDGFKNLKKNYDVAVISGMGTETIKHILKYEKLPKTLILSSHKNVYDLRVFMNNLGYKIDKEIVLQENKIYYDIIKYVLGKENLCEYDLLVGKSNDVDYINYIKNKYNKLYSLSKDEKFKRYLDIIEKR